MTDTRYRRPSCAANCLCHIQQLPTGPTASSRKPHWMLVLSAYRNPLMHVVNACGPALECAGTRCLCHQKDFRDERSCRPSHHIVHVTTTAGTTISCVETCTPRLLVRTQTTQRTDAHAALAATCSAPVSAHLTKAPRRCAARRRRNPRRRVRQRGLSEQRLQLFGCREGWQVRAQEDVARCVVGRGG